MATIEIIAGYGIASTSPAAGTYQFDSPIVVSATAASGHSFYRWVVEDAFGDIGYNYSNPATMDPMDSVVRVTATVGINATKYVYYNSVRQDQLTEIDYGLDVQAPYTPSAVSHIPAHDPEYELDRILYNGQDVTSGTIQTPNDDFSLHYYFRSDSDTSVWIYNNGWKKAIPWVYSNGWKQAKAWVYSSGWKPCR